MNNKVFVSIFCVVLFCLFHSVGAQESNAIRFKQRVPYRVTVYPVERVGRNSLMLLHSLPKTWSRKVTAAKIENGVAVKLEMPNHPPCLEWVAKGMVLELSPDGKTVIFSGLSENGGASSSWGFSELDWLPRAGEPKKIQVQGMNCLLFQMGHDNAESPSGQFIVLAKDTMLPVMAYDMVNCYVYEFPARLEGLEMPEFVKASLEEGLAYLKKQNNRGAMPPLR